MVSVVIAVETAFKGDYSSRERVLEQCIDVEPYEILRVSCYAGGISLVLDRCTHGQDLLCSIICAGIIVARFWIEKVVYQSGCQQNIVFEIG